jgi:predicted nucleotidyltransferase
MDQGQAVVRDKILRFHESICRLFPVRKVLLYGSHAKGKAQPDSDIDVAVVVGESDHSRRVEITAGLLHAAAAIDPAIEPKCIFWDEYRRPAAASILAEIIRTAIEIV